MAFMEIENHVERLEAVVFPEVWRRYGDMLDRGLPVILLGKVQQQDEGFKLIAEDFIMLAEDEQAVESRLQQLKQPQRKSAWSGKSGDNNKSSSASNNPPLRGQESKQESSPSERLGQRKQQIVYMKISLDRENPQILTKLQTLLQQNTGPLPVVLFYERDKKMVSLHEKYRIKPSPELFHAIEQLLGIETVKVK